MYGIKQLCVVLCLMAMWCIMITQPTYGLVMPNTPLSGHVMDPLPPTTILATYEQCPEPVSIYQDPSTGVIFVGCERIGLISINDTEINLLLTLDVCDVPSFITGTSAGEIYVACSGYQVPQPPITSSFILFGPGWTNIKPLTSFDQVQQPEAILVDPLYNNRVFVANFNNVLMLYLGNITVLADGSSCVSPTNLFLLDEVLYVTCFTTEPNAGAVIAITDYDTTEPTIRTVTSSQDCPGPFAITGYAFNATSVDLFIACSYGNVIDVTLTSTGTAVTNLTQPAQCEEPLSVVYDPSHDVVYAACNWYTVIGIDLFLGQTWNLTNSNECLSPARVTYNSNMNVLYTTCRDGPVLEISNPYTPPMKLLPTDDSTHSQVQDIQVD